MTNLHPVSVPISLGYKLRFLILAELDAQQLTQAALAQRIGFSQKHVSQMLNARCGLSAENADRMLRAINREWVVGTAPAFGEPVTENWQLAERRQPQVKCEEPTCPDFGDPDFGEATCPAEHAIRPEFRQQPPGVVTPVSHLSRLAPPEETL